MIRQRRSLFLFFSLAILALACAIPPEIIDAVYRLPTPTATPTPAPSAILYVSKTGNDENDCLSSGTACLTILAALRKAADNAAIHIGPGTYREDESGYDYDLVIGDRNVSLYGSGSPGALTTVLSGGGSETALVVNDEIRVVLENLVIADGGGGYGVGLWTGAGAGQHITLRNVEFRGNAKLAVMNLGDATIEMESINLAGNPGGAIANSGTLVLRRSRVTANGIIPAGMGWGAGVINNRGTMTIVDSKVSSHAVPDSIVLHNRSGGSLTLERSSVSGNNTGTETAILNDLTSGMTVINSTISGNSATGLRSFGDLRLVYSTLAANGTFGLYADSHASDPMTLRLENSLIENNGSQDCYFFLNNSIVFDRRGTILSDGSCAFNYGGTYSRRSPADELLGPLAENGGPTRTHALLAGSHAIDAAEGSCPATNQRGVSRPVGGGCDVGAYEAEFALTIVTPDGAPVPIFTPTPTSAPAATLRENANCRIGPGTGYNVAAILSKGATVNVAGRIADSTWLQVEDPKTAKPCWIAASLLEIPFDPALLPVVQVPPLPNAPGSFQTAGLTCSPNLKDFAVDLSWIPPGGQTGFRLYRNGELIATLGADATSYVDEAPKDTALTYEVEAFNAYGRSPRTTLVVPACSS